jgi:hypothetical protein
LTQEREPVFAWEVKADENDAGVCVTDEAEENNDVDVAI